MHAHWLLAGLAALALRQADRAAGLGDGRRARAARPVARAAGAAAVARGSSSRLRSSLRRRRAALGARDVRVDPERRRHPGPPAAAERAAARALRRAPERGEGRPRAARGGARACRAWSRATGRCARGCPRRVGFVPRESSAALRAAPRSLRARRGARATGGLRGGDGVGARPVVATAVGGLRDPSWTARRACSCRRATSPRCAPRSSGCSATPELRAALGAAARERARRSYSWPAATDALARGVRRCVARARRSSRARARPSGSSRTCRARHSGVITIGSFSLNDVLSTIGTPVCRSNSAISR